MLLSTIVNVTVSPTLGAGSSTDLSIARSADNGFSVALSWSSSPCESLAGVESGSNWSLVSTCATLVCGVPWSTVVWTVSVAVSPTANDPTSQMPVVVSKVPALSSET